MKSKKKIIIAAVLICIASIIIFFLIPLKKSPVLPNSGMIAANIPDYSVNGYPVNFPVQQAVDEFNARAKNDSIGNRQPLLTSYELLAALRGYDRDMNPVSDSIFDKFQNIARSGIVPKGAFLRYLRGLRAINGYDVDAWWIELQIELDKYPNDLAGVPQYIYRIRTTYISSKPHQ